MLGTATVSVPPKSPPACTQGAAEPGTTGQRQRWGGARRSEGTPVLGAAARHPPLVSKVTGSENSPATALLHARTRKFMYFMSNFSPAGTAGLQTGHGGGRRRDPVLGTATQTSGTAPGACHPQRPP